MLIQFWRWLGFHVHDWSPWDADGTMHNKSGGQIGIIQSRKCMDKKCNLLQLRRTTGF